MTRAEAILKELDARGVADAEYRVAFSTGGKRRLRRGETWRNLLVRWVSDDAAAVAGAGGGAAAAAGALTQNSLAVVQNSLASADATLYIERALHDAAHKEGIEVMAKHSRHAEAQQVEAFDTEEQEESMAYQDKSVDYMEAPASAGTVTTAIGEPPVTVELPIKFSEGHTLTANQASVLDAAFRRQFRNNMDANAKNRAVRFVKATTAAERDANTPLTAADVLDAYLTYEPSVGGMDGGISGVEKLRRTTAWRFWTLLIAEHNASVLAGTGAIIVKAGNRIRTIAPTPRRAKTQTEAQFAPVRDKFDADHAAFITMLLANGEYGPRIEALVQAEIAVRKAVKGTAAPAEDTVSITDTDLL